MPFTTEEEFNKAYEESLAKLDLYVESQVTLKQKADAKHHKRHTEINRSYLLHNLDKLYACCKCGALEAANFYEPTKTQMIESHVCFHCNHWEQLSANPKPSFIIIEGNLYSDGGNKPGERKDFLGFGGYLWKIQKGDRIWETNNLWSGGITPRSSAIDCLTTLPS